MERTEKEELKTKCAGIVLRPNPTSVMKFEIENLIKGLPAKEAKAEAEKEALRQGKYLGYSALVSKLCQLLKETDIR